MRIVNATYVSLDGVVQRPELWTFEYRSDDAAQESHQQLFGADALLMGRRTYDIFASHWPAAADVTGFAERMNALPKYVVSDTLTRPAWSGATVVRRAAAVDKITGLTGSAGQSVLQYGFGPVTRTLIQHGLLDEMRLWLHPLLVGDADPDAHLAAAGARGRFTLADVRTFTSGLAILTYVRSRG